MPSLSWGAEDEPPAEDPPLEDASSEEIGSEEVNPEETDPEASSNQSLTKVPSYYVPDIPAKRAQSLIQYMTLMERQDEIVQLSSLSNPSLTSANLAEDYYGLFLEDATGSPQGGILILHDNQQHGHWPDIVAPLREYLPRHGWTTLTIELPDAPARQRIPRQASPTKALTPDSSEDNNPENADPITTSVEGEPLLTEDAIDNDGPDGQGQPAESKEDVTDDSLEPGLPKLAKLPELAKKEIAEAEPPEETQIDPIEDYRKQNQQRIFAAMEYLRSQGQLNLVIIGHGIGAAWAIDYLAQLEDPEKDDKKGLTLVTIDATPSRYSSTNLKQQLEKIKLPFLDLVQPSGAYVLKQAKSRLAIMKRNKNEKYQQIIASSMTSYHEDESPTSRRIRGWLKTHAGGTLVKMKP